MKIYLTQKLFTPLFLISALLISSGAFLAPSLMPNSVLFRELYNSGHGLIFMVLAFLTCAAFGLKKSSQLSLWAKVLVLCFVYGAGIELLQLTVGRQASLLDLFYDMMGSLVGMALYLSLYLSLQKRMILTVICLLLLLSIFVRPLYWFCAIKQKEHEFPVLLNAESIFDQFFFRGTSSAHLKIVSSPESWLSNRSKVMAITFQPHQASGLSLLRMEQDWSQYQYFYMDVYNPAKQPLDIVLRIHDRDHNNQYNDRFKHRYSIKPGHQKIQLLLDYVKQQPDYDALNLQQISGVILFSYHPDSEQQIYVDNIYLR